MMVLDLRSDNRLGELPDDRELIPEVAVDCLEPIGQRDYGVARLIGGDITGIDVQDFGRFDSSMIEILVIGIERMVDSEVLSPGYHQVARDGNVAEKIAGQPIGCAVDAFAAARSHASAAVKPGAAAAYGAHATATVPIGVLEVIAACCRNATAANQLAGTGVGNHGVASVVVVALPSEGIHGRSSRRAAMTA